MGFKIILILFLILIFSGCNKDTDKIAGIKEGTAEGLQVEYVVKDNLLSYIKKSKENIITDDIRLLPNYPQDKILIFLGSSDNKSNLFFKEKLGTSSSTYILDIKNIQKGFKISK